MSGVLVYWFMSLLAGKVFAADVDDNQGLGECA